MTRAAVFVDRDGTVITEAVYLADPEGIEIIPGSPEALKRLRDAGYAVVLITNQSGIARGYYTIEDYRAVAARLNDILAEAGFSFDAVRYCPHHPDFSGPCDCRKPGTGMYTDAAEELNLDLERSFYVGDKLTDVEPGLKLGGTGLLVRTGYGAELEGDAPDEVLVVDDLARAADVILETGRR